MPLANVKLRVLLVDEEPDITTTISRAFEIRGHEVDVFNDSVKAAYYFKPHYYDACVLDFRMPDKTGIELARDIWRRDEKAQICFLTSYSIYEDQAKTLFTTMKSHCFLRKPMLPSAIVEHVEKHFTEASTQG